MQDNLFEMYIILFEPLPKEIGRLTLNHGRGRGTENVQTQQLNLNEIPLVSCSKEFSEKAYNYWAQYGTFLDSTA